MDHCSCGDELVVNVSGTKQTTYCQGCGREEETVVPLARGSAPIISLTRAAILKKINAKPTEAQQKKPKVLRDRTDYTKSRRAR